MSNTLTPNMPIPETILVSDIIVEDRQRRDLGDITSLAESIREKGLIHPITLERTAEGKYRLIAGGRRLTAIKSLGITTLHHATAYDPQRIGFVYGSELEKDVLHELELEENVRRKEMSWQELSLGIAEIHALKQKRAALDRDTWGVRQTGELIGLAYSRVQYNLEIARKLKAELQLPEDKRRYWLCGSFQDAWRLRMRDEEEALAASLAQSHVANAAAVAVATTAANGLSSLFGDAVDPLDAPAVAEIPQTFQPAPRVVDAASAGYVLTDADYAARAAADKAAYDEFVTRIKTKGFASLTELEALDFYHLMPQKPDGGFEAWYTKRKAMVEPWLSIPLSSMLHHGSCVDWMMAHPESVDHIITDPPYGIEMSNLAQQNSGMSDIDTVAEEHVVKENETLLFSFITHAYSCLKPNGYLVMWCDQMQWQLMYDAAIAIGFKVQRWPLTWVKSHRCINQAAQYNFTKTTEIAMVCRKGAATLVTPAGESHIIAAHDDLKEKLGHPFVKPFAVWEFIHRHISFEGQTILEPFAGRGSGVVSALALKRKVIACELNDAHYNALLENIKQYYLSINPNFTFR